MRRMVIGFGVVAAALALTGLAGAGSKGTTLTLVAYSTPKPVYAKLIAAFQQTPAGQWRLLHDRRTAARAPRRPAVAAGQPADVVVLSTGTDVNLLVDNGLVDPNWDKQSYNGVVWNSVVVFGLRTATRSTSRPGPTWSSPASGC